jgi:serpin B
LTYIQFGKLNIFDKISYDIIVKGKELLMHVLIFLIVLMLTFVSCDSDSTNSSITQSNLKRDLSPQASKQQIKTLTLNNNKFAFKMFEKLHKPEVENLFFSPYSISEALVMTYAGAKGETKNEMADVLHFEENDDLLFKSFNALDLDLSFDDGNYTLSVINALWPQKNYEFLDSYLDTIMVNFGAKLRNLDYANKPEESRIIINDWIEDKTKQRIKDLIPKKSITPLTRFVITNAIYFKAKWRKEFSKHITKEEDFTNINGQIKKVFMMNQDEQFKYKESDIYQVAEFPYKKDKSSMLIVFPKEGKYEQVIQNLESVYADSLDLSLYHHLDVKMPKFEFTTKNYSLVKHFKELGMVKAFNDANFSNMSDKENLQISEIIHKAFIKVDEEGSEAVAATTVLLKVTGGVVTLDKPIKFHLNRPFIFFIKDQKSDQILFMGTFTK